MDFDILALAFRVDTLLGRDFVSPYLKGSSIATIRDRYILWVVCLYSYVPNRGHLLNAWGASWREHRVFIIYYYWVLSSLAYYYFMQ